MVFFSSTVLRTTVMLTGLEQRDEDMIFYVSREQAIFFKVVSLNGPFITASWSVNWPGTSR